jgi:hypothetical protein
VYEESVSIDRDLVLVESRSPTVVVLRTLAIVILAVLAILVLLPAGLAAQAASTV